MATLKTLSLEDYRSDDAATRAKFCEDLLWCFSEQGFVHIRDHGLSAEFVAEGFRYNRELFRLSKEKKMTFAHPLKPNPHRGYSFVGQENISAISGFERGEEAPARVLDLKESFDCGAPENTHDPNVWPQEADLPGFKDYLLEYYERCHSLQLELLSALAQGLGLPNATFYKMHDQRAHELRLLHYLEVPAAAVAEADKTRIAEHTDFGTLTLLMQDGSGGLEVLHPRTRQWYPAECEFPTLTVNVGDSLMRLLNRRIHSACHRVPLCRSRIRGDVIPARYSIAYFGKPNPDASLKPLAALVTDDWPCAFDDVSGRQYELLKLGKIYSSGDLEPQQPQLNTSSVVEPVLG
ncbi:2-oxoglutarate-dependent dioxygenase htyE [Exophiala dermatitidis]